MKLFGKREAPLSRRGMRLFMRRFGKLGISLAAVSLLAAGGAYGWHNGAFARAGDWISAKTLSVTASAGFRVNDILVTGRERIPANELLQHLDIQHDAPIFGVGIGEAQKSIAEIPWVRDVTVTRRLPDKIVVEITERQPVALWQYQKKLSVIDETGRTLSASNLGAYRSLPLIVGEDAPRHVQELLGLLKAEPDVANQLVSAARIGGRRWNLRLKSDVTVKLPETDVELALRQLVAMTQDEHLLRKNIKAIDLRIPDQMVVLPGEQENAEPKKTI